MIVFRFIKKFRNNETDKYVYTQIGEAEKDHFVQSSDLALESTLEAFLEPLEQKNDRISLK
jgi:hypothetical protein